MRRRMAPVAGRVGPVVDVRSASQIPKALDLIKKGPLTLVFIYADWCGHCSTFKPKYLGAVNSPKRTTQAVMVNDAVVSEFNSALSKNLRTSPISVDGYPTTVAMTNRGEIKGEIPPSATKEEITIMATADPVSITNASSRNVNRPKDSMTAVGDIEASFVPSRVEELNVSSPVVVRTTDSSNTSIQSANARSGSKNSSLNVNTAQPVTPSLANPDMIDSQATPVRRGGGGLYSAIASAAYNLAPAGILLAGLHAVRGRKGNKRTRRTRRR